MSYPKKVLHALRRQDPRAAYRLSQLGEAAFAPAPADLLAQASDIDRAIATFSALHRLPDGYREEIMAICRDQQIPLGGLLALPDISLPSGEMKQVLATTPVPENVTAQSLLNALDFSQQLAMKGSQNATYLLSQYEALANSLLALEERDQKRILADPEITAIRVGKATLIATSEAAEARYTSARLARAATVATGSPVMVTGNHFVDGKLPIYYQQGDWTGVALDDPMPIQPHLVVEAMALRYHDPQHGDNVDLSGVDHTLSDPDYFDAFLRTVTKHTDRAYQQHQPAHVRMQYHDLRSVAALHQTQRNMRLPVSDTIFPALHLTDTTRVVARFNGGPRRVMAVRSLINAPDADAATLYFGNTESDCVYFSPANMGMLKKGHRDFSLRPSPQGGYEAAGAHYQFSATLAVPLQTRQQKALVDKFIRQPRNYRRYMSQSFDEGRLTRDSGPVSEGRGWFSRDTEELLAQHQARGIAALEIIKDPVHNDKPVYVSINVYTPTKNGWNIRRAQQVITDTMMPSQVALERMGLSASDYDYLAETTFSADRALSKVFDGNNRYLVMFPGAPTGLDNLAEHLPTLADHIRRAPHVTMQTYQKQALLSSDGRDTITVYPQSDRQSPARFDADAVNELIDGKDTHKRVSTCGNFIMVNHDGALSLQDLSRHTTTDLGSVSDMRKKVWQSRTPPSFHEVQGSERRLVTYSLSRHILKETAPAVGDPWIPVPYTDALTLADKKVATQFDDVIQKAFTNMMDNASYDFSLSPSQNAMRMASEAEIDWDGVVMGNTGGKTGRQFLHDIKKADPRFFHAVMAGRGVSEAQMLKSKQIPRNMKALSSITFGDVLTYCCAQYEAAFPVQQQHYHALRWLPTFIEQCPPTFRQQPSERFNALFQAHGIEPKVAMALYDKLYALQKASPRVFDSLYQDNMPTTLSTQSLQRDRAFIGQMLSTPTAEGVNKTLSLHVQNNQFRQVLKTLPMFPDSLHLTEHPVLSDMRRVMVTTSPVTLSESELGELTAGLKVLNSAAGLNEVNAHLEPHLRRQQDDVLTSRLQAIGQRLDTTMQRLPGAAIVASASGVREYIEAMLMEACHDTQQAPYNTAVPPLVLTHVCDTLRPHLASMGLSEAAQGRFDALAKRANSQYTAMQAIERLRLQSDGVPVLSDDRLSRLRDVAGWQRRLGHKTTPMRFNDALLALADDHDNGLPKATREALKRHANEDKSPSRQSLAYQLEQQMKRLLRQTVPPASCGQALRQLGAQCNISTRDPVAVMAGMALTQPPAPSGEKQEQRLSAPAIK